MAKHLPFADLRSLQSCVALLQNLWKCKDSVAGSSQEDTFAAQEQIVLKMQCGRVRNSL
jgi:hypothetical protein